MTNIVNKAWNHYDATMKSQRARSLPGSVTNHEIIQKTLDRLTSDDEAHALKHGFRFSA